MKKRILSTALTLALCLGLLPAAMADMVGWRYQTPEDPDAITFHTEVADFGTLQYGFGKEDCPTVTVSFTNTGDRSLWYIAEGLTKGGNLFEEAVTEEGWDSIQVYRGFPYNSYGLELKPGSSASVELTLRPAFRDGGSSLPAGVYDGELDFFFATSDVSVGTDQGSAVFRGGNYPLPYHFEVVYDGYMGGEDVMELDRESLDLGLVEKADTVTGTLSVTNRAQVEVELRARLADRSFYQGDYGSRADQQFRLESYSWTLAPGETAQISFTRPGGLNNLLGLYETELVLTAIYHVTGGGNYKEYRDEKVVPITFTLVDKGGLSVLVELESPRGPSGYFTSADGVTQYWGNDNIHVPYGEDLSLNIVPFDPEHGYVLAVERYKDYPNKRSYVGHDTALLAQDVTSGQCYRVSIASCAVPPADWARDAVGRAYSLGIFRPYDMPGELIGGNSSHGPDGGIPSSAYTDPITRKDFCNLAIELYRVLRPNAYMDFPDPLPTSFTDTSSLYVLQLAYLGVIGGVGEGRFDPNGQLTREQAAAILSRLAGVLGINLDQAAPAFADNASISSWATDAVGQMQASGIMGGVGNNQFGPQGTYSWEQSIATLMRLYDMTM